MGRLWKAKKLPGIFVSGLFYVFLPDSEDGGDTSRDSREIGRFIPLPSIWNRGKVGRVSFEKDAVEPDFGKGFPQEGSVLERYDPVYSKPWIADAPDSADIGNRSGEAMEDHPGEFPFMRFDHFKTILEAIAAMDDERQVAVGSPSELAGEGLLLLLTERRVMIEIYSRLPYSAPFPGVEHGFHLIEHRFPMLVNIRGMEAESKECRIGAFGMKPAHRVDRGKVNPGEEHERHSGLYGTVDRGCLLPGEVIHIKMSVGIDHFLRPVSFSTIRRKGSRASSERDVDLRAANAFLE